MPDLVATDSRLELGCTGKLGKQSFQVLGRVQLDQGRARWDEWYVSWSDGNFGWIAEAQGRLIVTRHLENPPKAPRFEQLAPGQRLELAGFPATTLEEVGEARLLTAAGELPFWPQLGSRYRFADATTDDSGYVTLDYGASDSGDEVDVFVGREVSYREAGLADYQPRQHRAEVAAEAVDCPKCGAPLALRSSETKSVVCSSCRSLCTVTDGKLGLLRMIKQRATPTLPLGSRATLFGEELEVLGWVQRACRSEDVEYTWSEYLLHGKDGYRWLSESNRHWLFLKPIPGASVKHDTSEKIRLQGSGRSYKHFQTSHDVRYADMQGEFYWQLDPDTRAELNEFIAPPYIVSSERTEGELQWTAGQSLPARELWSSFKLPGEPQLPYGVGPCDPNPYTERAAKLFDALLVGLVGVFAVSVLLYFALPGRTVLSMEVPIASTVPVSLSEPFELRGGTHALRIRASTSEPMSNAWVGLDISLIDDTTGEADNVGIDLSHFSGYDGGERWVEDERSASAKIGSVRPGRYVLRVEPQTDNHGQLPSSVSVVVTQGVMLWFPLVLSFLLLLMPALWERVRSYRFEVLRWRDSDHPLVTSSSDE